MHKPPFFRHPTILVAGIRVQQNKSFTVLNKVLSLKEGLKLTSIRTSLEAQELYSHAAFTAVKVFQIAANLHFLYLSYHYTGMNDPPSNTFALHRI